MKYHLFYIILSLLCFSTTATNYYSDDIYTLKESDLKCRIGEIILPHQRITDKAAIEQFIKNCDTNSSGQLWSIFDSKLPKYDSTKLPEGYELTSIIHPSYYCSKDAQNYDIYYDLHLIMPCSIEVINEKEDYPCGEINEITYTNGSIKIGVTSINGTKTSRYEPSNEYKGDIARMIMYAVTCYPTLKWQNKAPQLINGGMYPTLNKLAIDLLLKWHREDPVSTKEIERNENVYKLQFNRNPFIDFPDLAEYLWGNKIGESMHRNSDDNNPTNEFIHSTYHLSDDAIHLESKYIPNDVHWAIDGKYIGTKTIVPNTLAIGIHELTFVGANCSGKILISIIP